MRYVLKPLILSAVAQRARADFLRRLCHLDERARRPSFWPACCSTRASARNVDELVTDWAVSTWHRLRIHVFAALVRYIMDVFHQLLEAIERFLYTVDEWLRFRAGESRTSTIVKACARLRVVLRQLRDPLSGHADDRAASQPDQAFPGGHGVAQGDVAADPHDSQIVAGTPWQRLGLAHRGVHSVSLPRHVRLSRLGAERELAAVRGQSPAESCSRWPLGITARR